jgi:hypothetical protein
VAAWFLFYLLGEALLKLPSSFHDGTIWEGGIYSGTAKTSKSE